MVLQVLLSVKGDLLWLHLPVLDIHLVATQHYGNVFADSAWHDEMSVTAMSVLL